MSTTRFPIEQQHEHEVPGIKKRGARVERSEGIHVDTESNENWAVSYSDMLMVLMSFFIIFFSLEPAGRKNAMQEIALSLGLENKTGMAQSGQGGTKEAGRRKLGAIGAGSGVSDAKDFDEKISELLLAINMPVTTEFKKDAMEIHFPDNIYKPREYQLPKEAQAVLKIVIEKFKSIEDRVDIYLIGHTDSTPLTHKNEYVTGNFALSTLRAVYALELAKAYGFPEKQLFTQGVADNTRNSRTISLKIKLRGAEAE